MYQKHLLDLFIIIHLVILLESATQIESLDNGLALKPPMGWISWERFTCETDCNGNMSDICIGSKLYKRTADLMISRGFRDVGYKYVNIDDCWSKLNRVDGRLEPDPERFGDGGIKTLAQYLHSKDLKLGIYGDCGIKTCAGYPGQLSKFDSEEGNHFQIDAETFSDWEVDSFKFDGCNINYEKAEGICPGMAHALNQTNRPILLTCEWPFYLLRNTNTKPNFDIAKKSCNLWRYNDDVFDSWHSVLSIIDVTVKMQNEIIRYHGPGGWFDPDQLIIGNYALSYSQSLAQMAIWSIWSAPLFMSNDLDPTQLSEDFAKILKNEHLIAINQDDLGVLGLMVAEKDESNGRSMVFVKPIKYTNSQALNNDCPSFAIVYLYRSNLGSAVEVSYNLRDILLGSKSAIMVATKRAGQAAAAHSCLARIRGVSAPMKGYRWVDLVNSDTGILSPGDNLTLKVVPSGVRVVKIVEID